MGRGQPLGTLFDPSGPADQSWFCWIETAQVERSIARQWRNGLSDRDVSLKVELTFAHVNVVAAGAAINLADQRPDLRWGRRVILEVNDNQRFGPRGMLCRGARNEPPADGCTRRQRNRSPMTIPRSIPRPALALEYPMSLGVYGRSAATDQD